MLNFDMYMPARIVFGRDTEKKIGELIKPHTKKVLLHYGGGKIKRLGLYDTVVKSLLDNKIDYVELGGVVPNPRLSWCMRASSCAVKKTWTSSWRSAAAMIDSPRPLRWASTMTAMCGTCTTRACRLKRRCLSPSS